MPATHTNSYALGSRDVVLVEPSTPFPEERRRWVNWARGLESQGRKLVAIVATHHHADHIGGAAFFSEALNIPVWAHAFAAERLDFPVARRLDDGDVIQLAGPEPQRWVVHITPGHAPGHVCLHEPSLSMLIAGDMVASEGTILIAPGEGDMAEYIRQLIRLAALDPAVVLPAHGAPIPREARIFARYVEHRLLRETKVLRVLAVRKKGTLEQLLPEVYDDVSKSVYPIALLSLQTHLEKLVREGKVKLIDETYVLDDGVNA
ncbi:MAG: MBL fold metallo-hydrolase [Polyangiaceae bacterium]